MGKLNQIKNRIISDFLMPSRMIEYEDILKNLLEHEYENLTVFEFYCKIKKNELKYNKKYFINRHDIDLATAKEFFKIEKKYDLKSTYYFRLSTIDFNFMADIESYGGEASYHFEEIAQYCKDNHIKSKNNVLVNLDKIKDMFRKNFTMIEKRLGFKLKTVCSHGDFVNRRLNIINNYITDDSMLRDELGIKCEAYDKIIMDAYDIYVSDRPYPIYYNPKSIFECIGKYNIIGMLSHPKHWKTNFITNTRDNLKRVWEGMNW